jgi:hypothetical protein
MQAQQILDKQRELNVSAWKIWEKDKQLMKHRGNIKFEDKVIADISGNQVQLHGRAAWDDFEEVLGYRPKGLKQGRETGCNMIRLWSQYPKFDTRGKPLLDSNGEQVTYPKLFISSNCINTIHALTTARFKKGRGGILREDYEEVPEGYEGLVDAIRYLMVHLFHDTGKHFTLIQGVQ